MRSEWPTNKSNIIQFPKVFQIDRSGMSSPITVKNDSFKYLYFTHCKCSLLNLIEFLNIILILIRLIVNTMILLERKKLWFIRIEYFFDFFSAGRKTRKQIHRLQFNLTVDDDISQTDSS